MRMKLSIAPLLFFVLFLLLPFPRDVQSAAWWGDGARKDEWVLKRGGAMIFYQVKGESNNPDYKARMYLDGKLVETERNARGVFDDAINNTYKIIIFKGNDAKMSTEVTVRPGEEVKLVFDLKKDKVKKESKLLPASEIRLNSKSSQYVQPSDIVGFSSLTEPENDGNLLAEIQIPKAEEVVDSRQAEEQARKEQEEKIATLESDFYTLEQSVDQKFQEANERGKFAYWILGPKKGKLQEAESEIQKGKEKVEELKDISEDEADEGEKTELDKKIASLEQALAEQALRLEEKERNTSFWYRLKKSF